MKRGIMGVCSVKQAVSFLLAALVIFATMHVINNGLVGKVLEKGETQVKPININTLSPNVGFQNSTPETKDKITANRTGDPGPPSTNDTDKELRTRQDVDTLTPEPWNSSRLPEPSTRNVDMKEYAKHLQQYASADHWIIMTLIDMGCADMAVNFYVTSLAPFGITNYLFVGQDQATCDFMATYDIHCYVYVVDAAAGKSHLYHSKDFLRKMNIRTYMILDALNLGYHVIHTDVDMTFLKDPTKDFTCDEKCDIAPLWDCGAFNAGFLFIRNTKASRAMYAVSKYIADHEPKTDDQQALNRAIGKTKKTHGLKLVRLSGDKYLCGKKYWEDQKRNFAGDKPCEKCVVVHDNWIVSMEAKRYRLQEMNFWAFDGTHRYYSCPERKYLTFGTPEFVTDKTTTEKAELDALKNALAIGAVLNRTVILPQFHCGTKGERRCTLLDHLLVRNLETQFQGLYRESSFLTNPLVPESTKGSLSEVVFVESARANDVISNRESLASARFYRPGDQAKGATVREIKEWFGQNEAKVLRFHSLYGAFCCYDDPALGASFPKKLKVAFSKKGNYRQFG